MENKFNIGDEVTWISHVGKVVGFNGRGWPIVEWQLLNEVLVENPEEIARLNSND